MKRSIFIFLLIIQCSLAKAQEESTIQKIREDFKKWQPIIDANLKSSSQFFHYAWGLNFQEQEWYKEKQQSNEKFLFQKAFVIEDAELGTYVFYENYSVSGDWFFTTEHYFNKNNKPYFIFWKMNTFQADEPLTVEKRLYFDSDGQLIRNLQSTHKMNTKEESEAGFADREVNYHLNLSEMGFYELWNKE